LELLIIVLNNEEYLDEILTLMIAQEIIGIGILESTRVEQTLSAHIPIFAGLFKTMSDMRPFQKIILGLAPSKKNILLFTKELKKSNIDFSNLENGFLLSITLSSYLGEPL